MVRKCTTLRKGQYDLVACIGFAEVALLRGWAIWLGLRLVDVLSFKEGAA